MAGMSLAQRAYEHVQSRIIAGGYPAGAVLSEAALARELGISRTPVGEAIRQLAQEGLVEQVPRFGTVVRRIERDDLVELYEMREALEGYAAARAAAQTRAEAISHLERYCATMGEICAELRSAGLEELNEPMLRRFLAADMAFHLLVLEAAGNRRILKAVKDLGTLSRIFRLRRARHDLAVVAKAHKDHQRVLDAIRRGDGETAGRAMSLHIREGKEETLRWFGRQSPSVPGSVLRELPPAVLAELEAIDAPAARDAGHRRRSRRARPRRSGRSAER